MSSQIRVGDMVMGIMGVDGGYVGRVIRKSGKVVTYVDSDGKVRETTEYNLTKDVPPPGRFPRKNPPMYAHHLRERKTHGLNLKQMRRLYAMVSRGNQKAITFARNVLGIPFDETPSQVKAVVKHHVLDLAERKVRRNGSFASLHLHPSDSKRLKSFFDYVYSFYGKGGLYAKDFRNGGFSKRAIERAITVYLDQIRNKKTEWGGGDSVDRERVRMILQPSYSIFIPKDAVSVKVRKNSRVARSLDYRRHVSKGAYVWSKLSQLERSRFLRHHFEKQITPRSQGRLAMTSYQFLPRNVKIALESTYANIEIQ